MTRLEFSLQAVLSSRRINFTFCCWPPGPLTRREHEPYPGAVCEERATKPAGLRAAARRGAAAKGAYRLCCRASHLPTRRSRQNVNLFLREPLEPVLRAD